MARSSKSQVTRVVVQNAIIGTRREYLAPQSVEETLDNNLEIARAVRFCQEMEWREHARHEPPALSCAVRHDGQTITVYWFTDHNEDDAALAELSAVLAGQELEGGAI